MHKPTSREISRSRALKRWQQGQHLVEPDGGPDLRRALDAVSAFGADPETFDLDDYLSRMEDA